MMLILFIMAEKYIYFFLALEPAFVLLPFLHILHYHNLAELSRKILEIFENF